MLTNPLEPNHQGVITNGDLANKMSFMDIQSPYNTAVSSSMRNAVYGQQFTDLYRAGGQIPITNYQLQAAQQYSHAAANLPFPQNTGFSAMPYVPSSQSGRGGKKFTKHYPSNETRNYFIINIPRGL